VEGKSGAVLIQRLGMNRNHRGRKQVEAVLVADAAHESVPGAAGVGPVADPDQPLAAVAQLLAAGDDLHVAGMKLEKGLAAIEVVTLIGGDVVERQSKGVRVGKLEIGGEEAGRPQLEPSPNASEPVNGVVARDVLVGALVFLAGSELHVEGQPFGKGVELQRLHLGLELGIVGVDEGLAVQRRLLRDCGARSKQAGTEQGKYYEAAHGERRKSF